MMMKLEDIESLIDIIKICLSDLFEINEVNLMYFDKSSGNLLDAVNEFEPVEEYYSEEKIAVLKELNKHFINGRNFILNDDVNIPEDVPSVPASFSGKTGHTGSPSSEWVRARRSPAQTRRADILCLGYW